MPEGKIGLRQNKKIGEVLHALPNGSLLSLLFSGSSPPFQKICKLNSTFTLRSKNGVLALHFDRYPNFKRLLKHTKALLAFERELERRQGLALGPGAAEHK